VTDRIAPFQRAQALQGQGRDAMGIGKPRVAVGQLTRALELVRKIAEDEESRELEARVLITLANVEFELKGLQDALARLDQAAALAVPTTAVALHAQRGLLLLRAGHVQDAVPELDAAQRLFSRATPLERCVVLLNRGMALLDLVEYRRARSDFERCAVEAERAGLDVLHVKATHNLGLVTFYAGDLPRALQLMEAAFRRDPTISPGIALQGRARVLGEAGLQREADEVLADAAAIFRRDRLTQDLAATELDRARSAMISGDVQAARRFAGRARDRWRRRRDVERQRAAELVLLQADLAAGRPPRRLIEPALRVGRACDSAGLRAAARLAALIAAEAQLKAGDRPAAESTFASLGPSRRDESIAERLHRRYLEARLALARGAAAEAAKFVRTGQSELARYQASFGSIDLRTASAVHGRRLADLDISLALESGRAAAVFAAAERARAVSSRLPPVRPPDDPVAADLLADLRQTLESLRAVEQDKAASEPLLRKRRELERQIVARSWTRSGTGSVTRPASLDVVRAALAHRDCTMITYIQAADGLAAVVVGGGRVRVHDLGRSAPVIEHVRRGRADLDVLAHPRLPDALRGAVLASLARSLNELETTLLAPLAVDGPLVLISTGVLGQLPWASLPSLRGRPLVVAPSASKWLASTAVERSGPVAVTALAGPDLARGDAEAVEVARVWPDGQVLAAASTAALAEAMKTASVLHVAAHGVHQPENPLFSSVRMVDGPVFAHELDQNAHAPEHVVLSACEVGLATVRPGDEPLGLASVLLHLGTRSIIAGVARVGDEVAEPTMAAYHAKLASGADSATALAEALAEVDSDVTPPFVNFGAAWAARGSDLEAAVTLT
jgi:tetratricopeptide (TPR) repeat protein